ncbi:carboxymuconolactone decarboxylase family protein [Oerskovia sp. NPDC057915]|uniref:carboxymuconolactone decarboxylase family protein n=1 Tax=Oerskovia sp. NPDC057915 TaxID=3346280 RepID=UPI0036DD2E97
MPDTDRAHHDTIFGEHVAALATTDPELVETLDRLASDEALRTSRLDARTCLMVRLAALVACQGLGEYRALLGAGLGDEVTPVEVKEIVYQAVPYVGTARALDALRVTNEVLVEHGVELPLPGQSTTTAEDRTERGLAVQQEIVGPDVVASMYANAPADQAHVQRLLSANCFGDHYTRTGIDVPTRELLTFAMLVALGGADPQVRGHVAANRNVGNGRAVLVDVATQLLPYIGYPRTLNALRAVDDVAPVP